jgi:hypothetical protein
VLDGIEPEGAIEELTANMVKRERSPEFTWSDSPRKVSPETYRNACAQMVDDQRALSFMAGWATDAILRNGFVASTRMDMTSGQQKLLRDLRDLATHVTGEHFKSALLGGQYEGQSSFGLDPIAVRSHAHEAEAPNKSKAPGKPGLIWLAFESIPLHPVIPITANQAQTIGWRRYPNTGYVWPPNTGYVWPIWDAMLALEEVQMLRALPLDQLSERPGVRELWFSKYGSVGQYGMLLPAQRER